MPDPLESEPTILTDWTTSLLIHLV